LDDPADQNVDAWIEKNPNLLKLINNNKLKYLAFENKRSIEEEKDLQVKDLLSVVDEFISVCENYHGISHHCSLIFEDVI
jgi:hypothetical protein